eukprot:TRINITY_DN266_c0_g1_i5.p1 TRINITY_DN266_c0_g1~~TRINITY_DN266_c0_g1_i5.p1  ORF type:complete len:103 (-),score=19.67 TRINITY_DN266_c0_g1_i5:1499-1807(-)
MRYNVVKVIVHQRFGSFLSKQIDYFIRKLICPNPCSLSDQTNLLFFLFQVQKEDNLRQTFKEIGEFLFGFYRCVLQRWDNQLLVTKYNFSGDESINLFEKRF